MIAEIFPDLYDIEGRGVFHPGASGRRVGFRPTAPIGAYLAEPLQTQCKDFEEMRNFLRKCRARRRRGVQKKRLLATSQAI